MPFVGPLKGACSGLCPQKARRHSFWKIRKSKVVFFFMLMLKYMYMQGQKSHLSNPHGGGWFKRELKFFVAFLGLISFLNLIFSHNSFALYTPTLSASVDQANLQVNGNSVINSTDKTTDIPFSFTVNTNNRTGYTATLSSETDNTALTNAGSTAGAKIDSINGNLTLNNLPNNTWGYKFGGTLNYAPIPALSTPAQILQTTGKTNGNESNQLSIGMKLADNLESGNYTNKLILSFVSNPYPMHALMTTGIDFNMKIKTFETSGNRIEHISRSTIAPISGINTVSLEDEVNSDYEIKAWYDAATKTVYYYADAEKIILNVDSNAMFHSLVNLTSLDVSSFDTSKVKGMGNMFFGDEKLTSLDLSNFDTQSLTNMDKMFYGMSSLTSLNISSFNTSKVTNMDSLFYGMVNIENINVSNFDTRNVTNMNHMFSSMHKLKQLQLPATFNTSGVTDMGYMFYNSKSLTSLDVSMFNTEKVTNMREMFGYLESMTNIKFGSSFNTKNVTDMYGMFSTLCRMRELDLSGAVFDTAKVNDFDAMFSVFGCTSGSGVLEKIYVNNDFDLTSAKTYKASNPTSNLDIFHKQPLLRGAMGSYWTNPGDANLDGLRIDRAGVKGYFTRKP